MFERNEVVRKGRFAARLYDTKAFCMEQWHVAIVVMLEMNARGQALEDLSAALCGKDLMIKFALSRIRTYHDLPRFLHYQNVSVYSTSIAPY